ncbi:MAG: DegT/DnrJ/EryC1/StrS family aminotransferase, partial [bacterium]
RLYIIEDCAQATGAKYGEVRTGTIGSTGCFSFFPTKNLPGVGDGGMIVTNQDDLTEKLRKFRDHGRITGYIHDIIGYNSRLDSLQAAVLKTLLDELEEFNADRIANAKRYSDLFKGTEAIAPEVPEDGSHVFNIYTIRVRQRNRLQDFLQERGIGTRVYYPLPLHLQPCLRYLGYVEGTFPAAEQLAKEVLSLPVYPGISKRAIERVAETILEYLRTHS